MSAYNFVSFGGVFVLLGLAWAFSRNRRGVSLRTVLGGLLIQVMIAVFVFVIPFGKMFFLVVNDMVVRVLSSATSGTKFLFGRLALPPGTESAEGETSLGFFLAFQALPTIIFFAALMGALYYVGAMPWLIRGFGRLFSKFMRISGAESLCAASNIFVGVESALVARPHLQDMTRSELCTILTAGMGTIASSMLAFYVMILQNRFPAVAGHLVSASLLAAPGAVVMSKLLYPEDNMPKTLGTNVEAAYQKESNIIEAVMNGATAGVKLVVGISATLLAFLGIVALIDLILGALGGPLNGWLGIHMEWSLKGLLSYLFYPLTLAIGVSPEDVGAISRIIGERVIVTEVVSYQDLATLIGAGGLKDPRSAVVTVYALCGFAHIASMAIFVGGVAALAPSRINDLTRVGFRALVGATLSSLMTGAWAGAFFSNGSILF